MNYTCVIATATFCVLYAIIFLNLTVKRTKVMIAREFQLTRNLTDILNELNAVLKGEAPPVKERNIPPYNDPLYLDGWSEGWDACRDEVMRVIRSKEVTR